MGNPSIKMGLNSVLVDGFHFNVAMSVIRAQHEAPPKGCSNDILERFADLIKQRGLEFITDTYLAIEDVASTPEEAFALVQCLAALSKAVFSPAFDYPPAWRSALVQAKIPITKEHLLGIAYVYQSMIDLIENRISGFQVQRLRPPPGWQPDPDSGKTGNNPT